MMHLYIPSRSRAASLLTPSSFPLRWRERMHIVVPEDQVYDYRHAANSGIDVMGCPVEGISGTRQWILKNAHDNKIYMIDDDMHFCRRIPDWEHKVNVGLRTPSRRPPEEVGLAFDEFESWLDDFVCVSVSARYNNRGTHNRWFRLATRMNNLYGFNVREAKKLGLRFDRLRVMEDFDITLQMLTQGVPNKVSYDWAWNQRISGWRGGCSDYRTNEVQTEAAYQLRDLFPKFVLLVQKNVKSKEAVWQKRTDVRIQWTQAFKYGCDR